MPLLNPFTSMGFVQSVAPATFWKGQFLSLSGRWCVYVNGDGNPLPIFEWWTWFEILLLLAKLSSSV